MRTTYIKPDSVFVTRSAHKLELVMVGESDQIFELDAYAMTVWEGLERGLDVEKIIADIVAKTGRSPAEISKFTKALVRELVSNGLLEKVRA